MPRLKEPRRASGFGSSMPVFSSEGCFSSSKVKFPFNMASAEAFFATSPPPPPPPMENDYMGADELHTSLLMDLATSTPAGAARANLQLQKALERKKDEEKLKKAWWIDEYSAVQSTLAVNLSSYDDKPHMYQLDVTYGGWSWSVSRSFSDIKNFYVNLCRHDKSTFYRLQHHFPIVGSRREGTWKHAIDYNTRVANFLYEVAHTIDPVLYEPLRDLLMFNYGMAHFMSLVVRCQATFRGYLERKHNAPLMYFVRERAQLATYDIDRKRYFHCWQLAVICCRVLICKMTRDVHQEVLRLKALAVPDKMFGANVRQLSLTGDVGAVSFHPSLGWIFCQSLEHHQPVHDMTMVHALIDMERRNHARPLQLPGIDVAVANDILAEVLCEDVFFEAIRQNSKPYAVEFLRELFD